MSIRQVSLRRDTCGPPPLQLLLLLLLLLLLMLYIGNVMIKS